MKNTQIRCGTGRIRTANLSFITSALPSYYPSYRPDRQFLWPTMPLQDIDRTPIGLAISIVYVVWQIPLSFSFLLVTGFSGPVTIVPARFTVPGHTTSSGGWICRKSVAFYYLAAIMSRNSAVFRSEDSHSPSCPGMGGTALVLLRWLPSRQAMKLTKLRNVLSG